MLDRKLQEIRYGLNGRMNVLDVGSGHNPNARADVLVDKYPHDDIERGGALNTGGRQFCSGDIECLPFPDNEFDFVFANHVMEHTENPARALDEVARVGKAGSIVCPTLIWELMRPGRSYHRWVVVELDGCLVFVKKENIETPNFGSIFESQGLPSRSLALRLFFQQWAGLFLVDHRWEDSVSYKIEEDGGSYSEYFHEPLNMEKVRSMANSERVHTLWYAIMREFGEAVMRKVKGA